MFVFAVASLLPVILLFVACGFGGVWPLTAVLCMTVFVFVLDRRTGDDWVAPQEKSGHVLSFCLGGMHFALLLACVFAVGQEGHLSGFDKLLILIGAGLWLGQVSNSNAHELIHRSPRMARSLGKAIYCSLLIGHHASAHPKVHHIHVGTERDPNSARSGEGFYRFFWRAWRGGFRAGLQAEKAALAKPGRPAMWWQTPYKGYLSGALIALLVAVFLGGGQGAMALLILAAYAQVQLFLSDYVQHYGLRRKVDADGRVEQIGPQHSWNAPHWYSGAMMLNAPRHSDHHLHPMRPFPALELKRETMPVLPFSLPVMACIALVPKLWRKIMDPRLQAWEAGGLCPRRYRDPPEVYLAK